MVDWLSEIVQQFVQKWRELFFLYLDSLDHFLYHHCFLFLCRSLHEISKLILFFLLLLLNFLLLLLLFLLFYGVIFLFFNRFARFLWWLFGSFLFFLRRFGILVILLILIIVVDLLFNHSFGSLSHFLFYSDDSGCGQKIFLNFCVITHQQLAGQQRKFVTSLFIRLTAHNSHQLC